MKTSKFHRPHIHKEGRNIIIGLTLLLFILNTLIYLHFSHWAFAATLLLAAALLVFVTYFFRSPVRFLAVDDPDYVIAPADGRVVVIEPTFEDEYFKKDMMQISIFMSPFNVHANWYPIEGEILESWHQNGLHKMAWLPKSSKENERSTIIIRSLSNVEIMIRQVAGAMARRIVTYAKIGEYAQRNQHIGFIKFGSRVDMYLPIDTDIFVEVGDLVVGNESVIGCLQPLNNDKKNQLQEI